MRPHVGSKGFPPLGRCSRAKSTHRRRAGSGAKRPCWLEIDPQTSNTKDRTQDQLGRRKWHTVLMRYLCVVTVVGEHRGIVDMERIAKTGYTRVDQFTRIRRSATLAHALLEAQKDRRHRIPKQGCYEVVEQF